MTNGVYRSGWGTAGGTQANSAISTNRAVRPSLTRTHSTWKADSKPRDPQPIEGLDPELDAVDRHRIARIGAAAKALEDEPRERARPILRQLGAQHLVEVVDRQRAGHDHRPLVDAGDAGIGEIELVLDLPHELLEDVLERDDARHRPILTEH